MKVQSVQHFPCSILRKSESLELKQISVRSENDQVFITSYHSPDSNELLLTDVAVTVLVHLAEQLLGLAHIAALRPHHLVDGRDDPARNQSTPASLLLPHCHHLFISLNSILPLPSTSYMRNAQASFSSGVPELVACRANMNSLQ